MVLTEGLDVTGVWLEAISSFLSGAAPPGAGPIPDPRARAACENGRGRRPHRRPPPAALTLQVGGVARRWLELYGEQRVVCERDLHGEPELAKEGL